MKCCSLSTLGVIIGILNILWYMLVIIYLIFILRDLNFASEKSSDYNQLNYNDALSTTILIVIVVLMLIMIILSGLLIMAIIKKRHKLMLPWLIISFIGYVVFTIKFVVSLIVLPIFGISLDEFLIVFFVGALIICIQSIILWVIYTLYKNIHEDNNKSNNQDTRRPPVNYVGNSIIYYT